MIPNPCRLRISGAIDGRRFSIALGVLVAIGEGDVKSDQGRSVRQAGGATTIECVAKVFGPTPNGKAARRAFSPPFFGVCRRTPPRAAAAAIALRPCA